MRVNVWALVGELISVLHAKPARGKRRATLTW